MVNGMLIPFFGSCWILLSVRAEQHLLFLFASSTLHTSRRRKRKLLGKQTKGAAFVCVQARGPHAMGLVSFTKVILPAFAGTCVVSYAFWDLTRNRKIFGGTVPHTIQGSEWEKETNKRMDAWPREAAGPVVMNPISRQNYHKT